MKHDLKPVYLMSFGSMLIALIFSLTGCGSDVEYISRSNSILTDQVVSFESNPDATLTFHHNQTFSYVVVGATPCASSGTWIDNDIGDSVGAVQMSFVIDTCNTPSLANQTFVYQYAVEDRILTITSPNEEL